ncbi:MAG: GTP-binding protein [Candidatus Helarchaeota archaeon]|nr:GTP-binding protein [Candidatus Helarchaeota archaeon]
MELTPLDKSMRDRLSNFIDIPKRVGTLNEISKQDLIHVKGIDVKIATTLKNILHVVTIEELARKEVNEEEYLMLKSLGISEFDLNIWTFFSKMIIEAKISKYLGPSKTLIVGLDNAGKTAILNSLQNKLNVNTFYKLTPTVGVNHEIIQRYGMKHVLLDMGGQEAYRKQYIQKAEDYFLKVEFLMYVIDVQDPKRFDEALKYLQEVIKTVELLNEKPEFLIIIHKVDPDISDFKEIQDSINYLGDKVIELFKDKNFVFDITTFSIFNFIGDNKTVVKEIRDFITSGVISPDVEHKHKEDVLLKSSMERILNIVINLSSNVEQRLSNLEVGMQNFRNWMEHFSTTYEFTPKPTLETKPSSEADKVKSFKTLSDALRNELKSILKSKKTEILKMLDNPFI